MKLKNLLLGTILGAGLLGAASSHAAVFMKLDGVDGESTAPGHEDWIDLLSMGVSIDRPVDSGRTGAAKLENFKFGKEIDKSTPLLMRALVAAGNYPRVQIEFTKRIATGQEVTYMKYELENVVITSYSMSGDSDAAPLETVSLNFEKVKITYTPYNSSGQQSGSPVEMTWDQMAGTIQ